MTSDKQINPDELRKFLQNKYGSGIQVEVFPQEQRVDEEQQQETKRRKALEFNYKPSDIKEYLDRFVIQQDDAKKVLATAICDHYHHVQHMTDSEDWHEYKKQNIILIGPTGVGKTYLIQNIARLIGVPFVKADATKYSETGYVGGDVEDLVRELVAQADNDLQLAECGIVYLDEIDKIATPTNILGRDVSGHGVQRNLLKLMEETEVPLRSSTDIASQMQAFMEFQTKGKVEKKTINTRHILFIVSGAFGGLPEVIKKRIGSKQIGFTGEKTPASQEHFLFEQVKSVDFIEYGFEAEFAGRLPVVIHCNPLSVDDMFNILKYSEGSILKQYKRDFLAYGIEIFFTDDGMRAIAESATEEHTGARGLMSVCEKLFREFKYALPDSKVKEFIISRELVEEPQAGLRTLLDDPQLCGPKVREWKLQRFGEQIQKRHGVRLDFTSDAAEVISREAQKKGEDLEAYVESLFSSYEHAFNLLSKSSNRFLIDAEDAINPGETLERWIKQVYR